MAISGGTLALVVGALGVGGYVLYRKLTAEEKTSPCESMLQGAAKLAGYDLLPGINDAGAAELLCGARDGLNKAKNKVGDTITSLWGGGDGVCTSCCPSGTKPSRLTADQVIRDLRGDERQYGWVCRDAAGAITHLLRDDGVVTPYTPTKDPVPPPVLPQSYTSILEGGGASSGITALSKARGGVIVGDIPR